MKNNQEIQEYKNIKEMIEKHVMFLFLSIEILNLIVFLITTFWHCE